MARISKAKQIAQLTEELAIDYKLVFDYLRKASNTPGIDKDALNEWAKTEERLKRTQQMLRDLGIPVELIA